MNPTSRPFLRLWAVTGSANLADGILLAGLPVVATTITTDPGAVAAVTTIFLSSMGLAALPSGVLADRGDRRRIIIATNIVRTACLVGLVAISAVVGVHIAVIFAAAAVCGSTEVVNDVAAETAVPELVAPNRLMRAHGRLATTQVVMNDGIGAPIGGVLGALGIAWVLGAPGLLYALGAVLVAPLALRRPTRRHRSTGPTPITDVREGIRALRGDLLLRRMAVAAAFMNLANTAFFAVAVLLVIGPMQLPRSAYGLILGAFAVGGIVGGAMAERVVSLIGESGVLRLGPVVIGATYGTACAIPHPAVAVPALTVLSASAMTWTVTTRVLRQRRVPEHLLGRVSVTIRLVALCTAPVGGALAGAVAATWGVRSVGVVTAIAAALALALLWNAPVDGSGPSGIAADEVAGRPRGSSTQPADPIDTRS